MREIIINLGSENAKQREQLNQTYMMQKQVNQLQQGTKHLNLKITRQKTKAKELKDQNEKLQEQYDKSEQEKERYKMQNSILKQKAQSNSDRNNSLSKKVDKQEQNYQQIEFEQLIILTIILKRREKNIFQRIIESQKRQMKILRAKIKNYKEIELKEGTNEIKEFPQDIQLILYKMKQSMLKNMLPLKQLTQFFQNDQDPLEDVINKQLLKQKIKQYPFFITNESRLIRFTEWITKEQGHIARQELLTNFYKWLQPYNLAYRHNFDAVTQQSLNEVIANSKEQFSQKAVNGLINIVVVKETLTLMNLSSESQCIFEHWILEKVPDLEKIQIDQLFEPISLNKIRSKSSSDKKRALKASPQSNLKYRPDYHFRRFGASNANAISFLEFYTPASSLRISKTSFKDEHSSQN